MLWLEDSWLNMKYNGKKKYVQLLMNFQATPTTKPLILCSKPISPWTKWPPFRRRYFRMHFREWKFQLLPMNFSFPKLWKPISPLDYCNKTPDIYIYIYDMCLCIYIYIFIPGICFCNGMCKCFSILFNMYFMVYVNFQWLESYLV